MGHDDQIVLAEVEKSGRCVALWIAKQHRMTRPYVSKILRRLKRRGLVEHDGVAWRPTSKDRPHD